MPRLSSFAGNQRGGAAILFAVSATVLIGFGAMAVDVGNFFYEKRKLQTANDLAVLAAASDLPRAQAPQVSARRRRSSSAGFGPRVPQLANAPWVCDAQAASWRASTGG